MIKRLQKIHLIDKETAFLWGPRQTGKSTLLKQRFPHAPYYDLLLSDEFERINRRPATLREEVLAIQQDTQQQPVIIDEVQKVPALLDDIQWLMVNHGKQFILCGSSARKLKRSAANLLGGRAIRYELYPFIYKELPHFDLLRALNHGLLPRHYLSDHPEILIKSYIGDYLREEIAAEAHIRNIPAFGRFLEAAAFSHGEMLNYQNIASESGVSAPTVKEYFQILQDTFIGRMLPSFRKRPKRRVIHAPKFYFFDMGMTNILLRRGKIFPRSENFGKAFEHFIFQEISAHRHYSGLDYSLAYWRTASQLEVDFILGEHEIALEVKGTENVTPHHLKNLRAFMEEYSVKHAIVVAMVQKPRVVGNIHIMPWRYFLDQLWDGKLIK
ncbi:AAA family ATPase [bacterium]|nr:AAA family ATPase [bacterium]